MHSFYFNFAAFPMQNYESFLILFKECSNFCCSALWYSENVLKEKELKRIQIQTAGLNCEVNIMNKRMIKSVSIGTIVLLLGAGSAFAEGKGNGYGKEKSRPGASAGNWSEKKQGNNGNGRGWERKPESTRREMKRGNHNGHGGHDKKIEKKKKHGKKVTTVIVKPTTVVLEKKPKPTGNGTVIGTVKPGKVVRPVSRPAGNHVPSPKPVVKVVERPSVNVSEKDLLAAGIGGMLAGGLFATLMAASN